jgi:GNAT superfamily N-acetyltransferase
MRWLDSNPLVEFQGIDKVFDPLQIGRNPRFIAILPARKVDLAGRIALQIGKGNIATGPAEVRDFFAGAEISIGGRLMFALPSRDRQGRSNILLTARNFPNQCRLRETVDMIVTDYGIANLKGLTLRERALALIEIAHPDDRLELIEQAKGAKILYQDQIYRQADSHLYPVDLKFEHAFKNGVRLHFRPIKPSDEEEMRRLFYRFSNDSVYARYFGHIAAMPHAKMQEYVNVDWSHTMSIVGLSGTRGQEQVIAEARYITERNRPYAEVVFIVDEKYQGLGVGTYLYELLIRLGKERGIKGFTADVLFSNLGMMKVFRKGCRPVQAVLENGIYHLTIPLEQ